MRDVRLGSRTPGPGRNSVYGTTGHLSHFQRLLLHCTRVIVTACASIPCRMQQALALLESTRKLVPPDQQQGARPPSPGSAGLGKSPSGAPRSGIPRLSGAGAAPAPSALAQQQQMQPAAASGLGAAASASGRAGADTTPPLSAKSSYMSVSGRPSHEIEPAATRTPFQPGAAGQQQQQQQQQGREGSGHGGGDSAAAQAGAAAAGSGGGPSRLQGAARCAMLREGIGWWAAPYNAVCALHAASRVLHCYSCRRRLLRIMASPPRTTCTLPNALAPVAFVLRPLVLFS